MLPGGLLVLGVFIITTLELADDLQNALRRLIYAVEKCMDRKRLWNFTEEEVSERVILHICSSTKKISCRTYDVRDPKSSPRPADWKYQNRLSTSWLSLECTVHIDIHIPLSTTSVSYTLEKITKNGLTRWAKKIENGVYFINGQVKDGDCDLLEGQKKSKGHTQAPNHSFDVRVLTQLNGPIVERLLNRDLGLSVSAEEPSAVLPTTEQGAWLGVLVSGVGAEALPLHVALHPPEPCRRGRHRVPLASGTAWLGLPPTPTPARALPSSPAWSPPATEASIGGKRQAAGGVGVRGKFEQAEEDTAAKEEEEEEQEEEEEMVPALQRITDLELGMYALLGIFCLAILIFLVNGVVFVLRYQRKEPPDSAADPASPQPHNWVWLGTDQEELSRQLDRGAPELPSREGSCPCGSGVGGEAQTPVPVPVPGLPGNTPGPTSTLTRKEAGGRRKRVEFVTFSPVPPAQLPEEPVAVQSILVAGEEDIRWVCEDMGLKDPEELRNYMERIRGSS